jgi:pimeloyl-ACP methyl ester carboxylesterase
LAARIKMPTAKVSDINIYYEVHGEGEALVLIMGYTANTAWWGWEVPVFSQQYRVVAFDNRGSGQSDKPDVPYTMETMAGDLAGLLEAIGINAAHIFGVSMGGMIAQHFALRYPERVGSLILGCTTCGGPYSVVPDAEAMAVLADFEHMRRLTPEERIREMIPFLVSQEFVDKNAGLLHDVIAKMMEHIAPLHGAMRQAHAIWGHDTYERLPEIKVPTLVIAGDADRLIPVENSRILASRIPRAELAILKNMGHGFITEAADEANRAVLDFLRRHRGSR